MYMSLHLGRLGLALAFRSGLVGVGRPLNSSDVWCELKGAFVTPGTRLISCFFWADDI